MFLISNNITKQVINCKINARSLSDRAAVELDIDMNAETEKGVDGE